MRADELYGAVVEQDAAALGGRDCRTGTAPARRAGSTPPSSQTAARYAPADPARRLDSPRKGNRPFEQMDRPGALTLTCPTKGGREPNLIDWAAIDMKGTISGR